MIAGRKTLEARNRRASGKAFALNLLGGKCVECGTKERLHFDHIDPSTKLYNIALILHYNREILTAELKKCQLLCSSHHGMKTARDNGRVGSVHGTVSRYNNHGCRCLACTVANTERMRERRAHATIKH